MATKAKRLQPLVRAQKRRSILPWYFDLSGKGLFLLVVLGASLLGLLALAQAGRVVSVGYQLKALQQQEKELRWEQEDLLAGIAEARDPEMLEAWATSAEVQMEELTLGDISFIYVPEELPTLEELGAPIAEQP